MCGMESECPLEKTLFAFLKLGATQIGDHPSPDFCKPGCCAAITLLEFSKAGCCINWRFLLYFEDSLPFV